MLCMTYKTKQALLILLTIGIFFSCSDDGSVDPIEEVVELTAIDTLINYGSDERQHYQLLLPKERSTETPIVMLVHGGAWTIGPKADTLKSMFNKPGGGLFSLADSLLSAGYGCAIMKYRLVDYCPNAGTCLQGNTNEFEEILDDIQSGFDKLDSDATELQYAANRYGLLGESAAGNIVLMYSYARSNPDKLKAVVDWYGPARPEAATLKNQLLLVDLLSGGYFPPDWQTVNPIYSGKVYFTRGLESTVGLPIVNNGFGNAAKAISPYQLVENDNFNEIPTLLMHGDQDIVVPISQSNSLGALLNTNDCDANDFSCNYKLIRYNGCGHGWSNGSCDREAILDDTMAWFAAKL